MKIIVQKFGGTSVASEESRRRLARRVLDAVKAEYSPVVVVSAMGRAPDPYSTDTLIRLARSVYFDTAPRELDLMMSCGEVIASVVVCNTLRAAGLQAIVLTGGQAGIITDDNFNNAQILKVEPSKIMESLSQGKVVVVAGFQGITEKGDVTTLGRGGSDTTAAAIGAALCAEVVEIYTDVDGIKTADPRLVPNARTIEQMTYEEICQMAHESARVIHPRAVQIAMKTGVPLRVRSTFEDAPGTLVTQKADVAFWPEAKINRPVTGITHISGLSRIQIVNNTRLIPMSKVFRHLADGKISVDMILVTKGLSSFVVNDEVVERAVHILRELGFDPVVQRDCAKVSAVGIGMRGVPGVMANVAQALDEAGVEIIQTADSHMTISCLVRSKDLEKAARALHSRFGLETVDQGRNG